MIIHNVRYARASRRQQAGLFGALGVVLALGHQPLTAQGTAAAQDDPALARAQCAALLIPRVRQAVDSGRPPLLILAGKDRGPLTKPRQCPDSATLARRTPEIRVIRPFAAGDLYGERGKHGAVLMDAAPAGTDSSRTRQGRSSR